MKKTSQVVLMSFTLICSAAMPLVIAQDLIVQKTGYMRELASQMETLEFGGNKSIQYRQVIDIPEGFGRLLTLTTGGEGVVFWFQNDKGEIRNVSVPVDQPVMIQRKGTIIIEPGLNG